MSPSEQPPFAKDGMHPEIDSVVYDKRRRQVGTVVAVGFRVLLHPQGGGREWEPEWSDLRHASEADDLGSRTRAVNRATGSLRAAVHPEIRSLRSTRDPGE